MKVCFLFLLLLSSICIINSLYIYIEPREKKCLADFRMANTSFDIVYYVSGQEEEKNIATIEDNRGNVLTKTTNRKNFKFSQFTKEDAELIFCFENLAPSKITLSF